MRRERGMRGRGDFIVMAVGVLEAVWGSGDVVCLGRQDRGEKPSYTPSFLSAASLLFTFLVHTWIFFHRKPSHALHLSSLSTTSPTLKARLARGNNRKTSYQHRRQDQTVAPGRSTHSHTFRSHISVLHVVCSHNRTILCKQQASKKNS